MYVILSYQHISTIPQNFNPYRFQPGQNLRIYTGNKKTYSKVQELRKSTEEKKKKQNKQADLNALFHIHFNSHLDTILAISCCFLEK